MTGFSIADMLRAMLADSWGKAASYEFRESQRLHDKYGVPERNGVRLPDEVLQRDLNAATSSAGGYLTSTRVRGYIPALQPASVALSLGARVETVPPGGGVAVPRGTTGISTTWLANETAQATETQPVLGQIVTQPKILTAFAEVSRQLLLQSNAEELIRVEFSRAAGAALDAAIINGSGTSGQPTGILNTASIGAFTGASLSQSALRNAQADVNTATAVNADSCGYVTTPAVAEILATRQRFTGSDRALWEGPSAAGTVEGCRAMATTGCPAATALYGDWSRIAVFQWEGGLVIELDPYTKFSQNLVGVRLLFACDVVVEAPAAFTAATSVS